MEALDKEAAHTDRTWWEGNGTFRTHNPKRRIELLEARIKELELRLEYAGRGLRLGT